jgi:A/G-specific adenine glycosylase
VTASAVLHGRILDWYAEHARELPWREPRCTAWGVFVSEVMAQQTPLARVEPVWRTWLARWPTPADLAADSPGEAVRAWGRLGYPRRALRLHDAARAMVERFDGAVPVAEADLRSLPGVGEYTAAAVAAFAFGRRATVVDTNVRRVQARLVSGREQAAPSLTRAERDLALSLLPDSDEAAATWNVAVMELGALVCTARGPRCAVCPVLDLCRWVANGRPVHTGPRPRTQAWTGTDRQVRGEIVQRLRDSAMPLPRSALLDAGPDPAQVERCLDTLVDDGLVEPLETDRFALPA